VSSNEFLGFEKILLEKTAEVQTKFTKKKEGGSVEEYN